MKTDLSMSSSAPRPRNIVISGTNFWNPGDDFVRDGVIRVLHELFPATPLNFLFYNFNADFFPQDKFAGIGNYVSKGDLDQYRDAIDDVVIAGLSAGDEIKDLYRWVIANGLAEKVLLIGAGYENSYVADHVLTEPEATIFRKARIVIGRTDKTPAFVRQTGVPYVHLNCPAMLSVPEVKKVPAGQTIQRIGFSIQLPHEAGIANHSCDRKQYELAMAVLRDLSRQYQVEVVAHHKTEYFHFLKLLRGENIPVLFSSFYQDLHALYPRYDLVITTRLHSSLFANGHGIPGIIINDTDRHTHTLEGFPHSAWVNSREGFQREFKRICACNLADIAREAHAFKCALLGKYVAALNQVIAASSRATAGNYTFDSEKKEQALVRSLVKPGMVVFDVGANIGKYTKLFSLLVGDSGKVFAFEPDPRSAQRVRQLAAADALANVSVLNQAVAECSGAVTLNQFPEEYCSWNSLGRPQMEDPRNPSQMVPIVSSVEVEAVTLDAFCREHGITQIDYLKLDVEGAEFRALQGAQGLLKQQAIRFLQFEVSLKMLEGLNTSARPVFDLLAACGYECHAIAADGEIAGLVSDSSEFYENYLAIPAAAERSDASTPVLPQAILPVHFFTIVLNGQPFIQHHINVLRRLPFQWHWHIVEGMAELNHDTAWSKATGGRIPAELHCSGLSVDGTTEYLDALKKEFPENITIYRQPAGKFWDGKREMVNAPLANISGECLLWQIDADELWTETQIIRARDLFRARPEKTAAMFFCHYFVGKDLVVTSRDTYGNNSSYEWLRVWRYQPGDRWISHEPPRLGRNGADVASLNRFSHAETEAAGLVFQHFAYTTEAQVLFKESYYGYNGAVSQWRRLQSAKHFPQRLGNHLSWVNDEAMVNTACAAGIERLAPDDWFEAATETPSPGALDGAERILFVRTDAIGDAVLASAMLEPIRRKNPRAKLAVLCQQYVADIYTASPFVDSIICFDGKTIDNVAEQKQILAEIAAFKPDVILNSIRSRFTLSDELTLGFPDARHIAIESDAINQSAADRAKAAGRYSRIVPSPGESKLELERHRDFLAGLGISVSRLTPKVWTSLEDEALADAFFQQQALDPLRTLALFPFTQHEFKDYPAFAEALKDFTDWNILLMGGPETNDRCEQLARRLPCNVLNLAGRTSLREMAAIIRRCRIMIGSDTSGIHIACAVGVPNVVVLGGGHPGRFVPYSPLTSAVTVPLDCFGCNQSCKFSKVHCVKDLAPPVVAEAIRQTLAKPSARPRLFCQDNADAISQAGGPRWKLNRSLFEATGAEFITVPCGRSAPSKSVCQKTGPAICVARPMPKISIVTPSFNQGEYLEECLDSILSQNYPNLEYIVMDGGSQDRSIEIIKRHAKHLAHWQSAPDGGQYHAIQKGLERTTGEIMFWLNSSDKLHPGSLEIVSDIFAQRADVEWIMGRPTSWNENGLLTDISREIPRWSRETYLHLNPRDKYIQQESTFWRRSLWNKAGKRLELKYKHAADFELWARFFRFAQLHPVDALLGGFRTHTGQKTAVIMREYVAEVDEIAQHEISLLQREKQPAIPPAPPLLDPLRLDRSASRITPENFGYFTYSKQPHFGYFKDHALTLYGRPVSADDCDLKFYQDLLVYTFIKDNLPPGARILEIGGADSRVLRALKHDYECWNLDKLEGIGNGVTSVNAEGYRLVRDYLGNFSQELPPGYFDFVFSISVIEHLKENADNFRKVCLDLDRVMKPGAYSLHCLDVVQRREVWTNKILPFLFENIHTANQFIPLDQMQMDPHTFFMPERIYDQLWKVNTRKSYQEFGRPLSYNVLWRKTDSTFRPQFATNTPAESTELTPAAQRQVDLAEAAISRNDAAGAITALASAHNACPNNADILIALGNVHFHLGDFAGSFAALQPAAQLRRNDPLVHVLLASAAVKCERMPEFEQAVSRALELDPKFAPAHRLLADLNLQAGRYADAAREYSFLFKQNQNDIPVLLALGKCLAELRQMEAAQECYAHVLKLDRHNQLAAQNLEALRSRPRNPNAFQSTVAPNDPSLETIGCPFCQSRNAEQVRKSADIVRCNDCNTVYLRTRAKKEVMERLYQTYADDGSHMALPKTFEHADRSALKRDYFLKEILTFTKPEGKLLDVGCGWGAFLLNGRQHGFEVSGLEITRKAAGYGNQSLQIPIKTTQFLDTDYAPDSHSVITMLHVFEHLPYPKQALDKVFQVLKPGGMFCGIVPNFNSFCSHALGERWYWLDPNYHYVHYTPATLRKHLEAAGFIVERIYTQTGDYGREPIKKLLANQDASNSDPTIFSERLKQIETEGRGEEIRFFARKPAQVKVEEPVEIVGGESLTNPLVTVSISTYNSEAFLRPALENLARQTIFPQVEVIVVDSGSQQNERSIALEFANKYPNVRYVRTVRETLQAAWNRSIALGRGRYWANLNADDTLRNDALEILAAALDKHADCALAYGDTAWTTQANDTFPSNNIIRTVKYPDYAPIYTLFYCVTGCVQFWRTESLRKLGGYDASLRNAGDYGATLKLMAARMNAVHVPEVLSLFYQNTTGLTQASNNADLEHEALMNRYRESLNIANIFEVEPGNRSAAATALAALGNFAAKFAVPWEDKPSEHVNFAFDCFHRALDLDPENAAAGTNLAALSHKLGRLESDQAELIRRWPKMQEWIAVFKMGDGAHVPFVKHAVLGPVYRPAEEKNRPTAEQLAREPRALRPWISRIEGRHVYLSDDLFPRPSGLRYDPAELQDAAKRLGALLRELPKFYAHFGGAGDALVLMASFYDKRPDGVIFSYPNSVPATKALFEAFPKLSKIYFLPQHSDPFFHIILRYAVYEMNNCLGAGATPKFGYDEEWKASLDIEKKYHIKKAPHWAAAMRNNAGSRRVAVAPKGSLTGMVGSKRNIIPPELWPQVIAHIIERGYEPVIFGVPSEAKEYPALPGCEDARGETFAGQMKRIGECAGLVGADSWAKTFTALAEIPTIVFEPSKGADLIAWKDPSDWVFIEPWSAIKMVRTMDDFRDAFDSRIAGKVLPTCSRQSSKPVVAWEGSYLDYGSLSNINRELTARLDGSLELTRVSNTTLAPSGGEGRGEGAASALRQLSKSLATHAPQNTAVTVRHQWPPNWSKPATGKLVVIQPWEYGALPKAWVQDAANVDEFWVPSPLVRAMYVDSGIAPEKVRVIPNGVDTKKFRPGLHALPLPSKKKFKFLFVGGTIYRKGIDVLLEAFQETFTAADDVALVIKDFGGDSFYRGQTAQEVIRNIQQKPGAPEIVYLTQELSPEEMPALYAACDCLVLPYRGEGFGMPVLEAMSCGLPVIVTGGGATDFFVTTEAGWILPSHGLRLGDRIGDIQLVKNGWLRQPSKAHLGFAMENAFKNPAECRRRGMRGRGIAERRFDWSDIAATVAHRLRELAADQNSVPQPRAKAELENPPVIGPVPAAPKALPACARLGDLIKARELLAERKFADAWQATLNAIKARPFHPEGFLLLAEIASAIGDVNTARTCAQRARDFAPNWNETKQFLKKAESRKRESESESLAALMAKDASRITHHASRVSICLIVKNEEKFLGQCLASIRNLAHQIVVVDTGSTDRTIEIAKEHGAEVFSFAWCDDFSAARNAALEHATGDWILMLDADEELPADQHAHLLSDVKKTGAIAHRLPFVNHGQEADGRSFVPRLFRNAPGVFFVGRVHEQVFPSLVGLGKNWGLGTALGTAQIVHHGYSKELVKDRNKIERNLALLRKAIEENPTDANLTMNLGLELVRCGDLNGGIAKYREAFRLMSAQLPGTAGILPACRDQKGEPETRQQNAGAPRYEIVPELREVLLSQFTSHLYKVREHEEVVRVLTSPLAKHGGLTATLHFTLGLSCFELKNYRETVEQMRQCLAKRNQPALSPINKDIHTAAPQHCMALSLVKLGDNAGAEKAFQAALAETGRTEEVRLDYAKFLAQQNRQVDALHKLHEIVEQNSSNVTAWRLGGEIALSKPEFFEFAADWTGEASKHLANDIAIVAQRAEALMLSGDTTSARELWRRIVKTNSQPRAVAALILCEFIESEAATVPGAEHEPAVSREFLLWYQKLIAAQANKLVKQINERIENLSRVLPRAAGVLEKALVEAQQTELVGAGC